VARKRTTERERDHVDRWLETPFIQEIPNLDLAVEGIVDRINGLARRFTQGMERTIEEFGLSYGEWKVLSALRRAGPPYRRSPGQLAAQADISSGAMTNRLDRLETQGLIRRLADPSDRRGVLIELTDKGDEIFDSAIERQIEKEKALCDPLSATERKQLAKLLRRLMLEIESAPGFPWKQH
jgi:DNA-binding MarR family transcriptional regulator